MSVIYLNDNDETRLDIFGFSFTIKKLACNFARMTFDDGLAIEIKSSGSSVLAVNILEAIEKTGRLNKWAIRQKIADLRKTCLSTEIKLLQIKEELRKTEGELNLTISALGLRDHDKADDEQVLTRYELNGKVWVWKNTDPDLTPTLVFNGEIERVPE